MPPQHGLYTAIIAGVMCALLGGTRFQVTGPTAAFVVILVPIVQQVRRSAGLLVAGMMAGVMLVVMGLARLGRLMQFVPHPVTTGFTMGIAVVIALLQLKDVFGLKLSRADGSKAEGTFEYLGALSRSRGARSTAGTSAIAALTLALLIVLPRVHQAHPGAADRADARRASSS